ncbi:MAG: TonB-dependent receptor [Deltaproteobacteria bacterium]|nr:TonB-dependent receptor [Deltaproteobacteria bacterium]
MSVMNTHRGSTLRSAAVMIAVGIAVAAMPRTALSQSPPPSEGREQIEQVEVWEKRLPVTDGTANSTIGGREAEERAAKDIGELLSSSVPGVSGQRYAGSHVDPVIRGMRADRLNVSIDGTKIWGADPFRMDPPTSLVDVEEIESIEVVKGPYTVTRGPAGIGATVNIITKAPELSPEFAAHGALSAGYVTNVDGWGVHGATWAGGATAAARLAAGYRDFENYQSGSGELVPSGFENRSFAGKLLWQPTRSDRLRLDLNLDSDRNVQYATTMMNADEDDAVIGSLAYSKQQPLPALEELQLAGYYNYVHHRMSNRGKPDAQMMPMVFPLDSRTAGGRVQANASLPGNGKLAFGGDTYYLERQGTRHASGMGGMSQAVEVFADTHILDGGLFAELAYPLLPGVRTIVGARLDLVDAGASPDAMARSNFAHYNGSAADDVTAFEINTSANGRLIYSPIEALDLFAALGRSLRTADTTERFFALGPGRGGYVIGNPLLDPEQSFEADIGANANWQRLSVNGSFFYNRIDDYIQQVKLATADLNMDGKPDTIYGYRNLELATLAGLDFGASYALTGDLSALGSLAYVRAENEDSDQPLPEIPPLEGSIGLRYERARAGSWLAWVNPRLRLVDRQDRIDAGFGENETPGFATLDLLGGLRWGERYELGLALSNLSDHNYHEHMTRLNPYTGTEVPEPGRMVSLTLRASL